MQRWVKEKMEIIRMVVTNWTKMGWVAWLFSDNFSYFNAFTSRKTFYVSSLRFLSVLIRDKPGALIIFISNMALSAILYFTVKFSWSITCSCLLLYIPIYIPPVCTFVFLMYINLHKPVYVLTTFLIVFFLFCVVLFNRNQFVNKNVYANCLSEDWIIAPPTKPWNHISKNGAKLWMLLSWKIPKRSVPVALDSSHTPSRTWSMTPKSSGHTKLMEGKFG